MGVLHAVRRRLVEALGGSLFGQSSASIADDPDLAGFRPITDRVRTRDLDMLSHKQSVQVGLYMYGSNNMAGWLIDTPVALTVGTPLGYSVEVDPKAAERAGGKAPLTTDDARDLTEEIRQYLDLFWRHPLHDIEGRADEYAKTFLATGHLVLPVASVNPVNGVPALDLIDAEQMTGVRPVEASSIVPAQVGYSSSDADTRWLDCIRPDQDGLLLPHKPNAQGVHGCLYFPRRSLLNSMRGTSYLMNVADWLDGLDQGTWTSLDRGKLRNAIVWHLQMVGEADPSKIAAEVKRLATAVQTPGQVYGSNERITLEAKSTNLEASDTAELYRLIRTHVLGSKSMPESWYSEGGNANRATAAEQTDVAYKALLQMQAKFRGIFRTLLWFGYDSIQAKQRSLPLRTASPWLRIEPTMPTVQERDTSRQASTVSQLEGSLEAAVDAEFISRKSARKIFLDLAGKLVGEPMEVDVEEALIQGEEQERDERNMQSANALASAALARAGGGKQEEDEDGDEPAPGTPPRDGDA